MKYFDSGPLLPNVCVVTLTKYDLPSNENVIGNKLLFINKNYLKWLNHHLISFKNNKFLRMIEWKSDEIEVEFYSEDILTLFESKEKGKCVCDWNIVLSKGCQCGGN